MLCYNKDVRRKKATSSLRYVKTSAATEFLYPFDVSCLLCGDELDECSHGGFCENCRREIRENTGRICQKCGRALIAEERFCEICRERERKFDCARSYYVYEGGIRRVVTGYKYGAQLYAARYMARDMAELYEAAQMGCSVIVPSPTAKERVLERGFDHIELICEYLSDMLSLPLLKDAIIKEKNIAAQAGLSGKEREENVKGAYAKGAGAARLKGAGVLIVDDVLTTGATASELARIAYKCGAAFVKVLTYASTRQTANTSYGGFYEDKMV